MQIGTNGIFGAIWLYLWGTGGKAKKYFRGKRNNFVSEKSVNSFIKKTAVR
jgi:hypothetical protein